MNALRWLHALLLRYQIWETEHWLRDCARDGLITGKNLELFRADLCAMRVRLARLQRPLQSATRTAAERTAT